MNHEPDEHHAPVSADIRDVEVISAEEKDELTSPMGVKGLGEIGICGTAAVITNAIFRATGMRMRMRMPVAIGEMQA